MILTVDTCCDHAWILHGCTFIFTISAYNLITEGNGICPINIMLLYTLNGKSNLSKILGPLLGTAS